MFVKDQFVTVFNAPLKDTDNVSYRNLSVGLKQKDGTYVNESWGGRFVGDAKKLVDTVPEKTRLKISGIAHTGYDKEKKNSFPYIFVTAAEVLGDAAKPEEVEVDTATDTDEEDW